MIIWDLTEKNEIVFNISLSFHPMRSGPSLIFILISWKKEETRQSRRYAENPRNTTVFWSYRPSAHFFEKKKTVLDDDVGECMYQISGFYRFLFGQGALP